MDPIGITASIIAILQLTAEVIKYLQDFNDAPKECHQFMIEASNLQNLLINLLHHLAQGRGGDPWFKAVQDLNVAEGPLIQYRRALTQLQSKVGIQHGTQAVKRRLLWKFSKEEVTSILTRIDRLKSLVVVALEMDHFNLSQAIKVDLQALQNANKAIKDDTAILRETLPSLQSHILTIRDVQSLQLDTQQHEAMMQWLSPIDFQAQQHDILSRRQEGTGQWLLNSHKFKEWLQGTNMTLLCPGIPGAGKTMMAAIAIDHLGRMAQQDVGLAYLYCNYNSQPDQSVLNLLSALLKQLGQGRPDITLPITHLYNHHLKEKSRPSLDNILDALVSVCTNHTRVYFVVDALDECASEDSTRLIEKLRELQARTEVRILFTSRFIPEITEKFRSDSVLEVRASGEDVKRYVAGQIPRLPKCIRRDDELAHVVQNKIVEAVDGMFLLARLYVDSLLDKRTKQKVLSTLEKLSKGATALDGAYRNAIQRIDGQLVEDRSLARRTISWISYAQRPLTTKEICHALAIELGDRALHGDNVYDVEDVISVCAGLVTVDEESNIIRLVHYTTQEYFEGIRLEWNPGAEEEIASTCLTYLMFDTFHSDYCWNEQLFRIRMTENIFLDYAARYWAAHVRPVEATVSNLALTFLRDEALVACVTQVTSVEEFGDDSQYFSQDTIGLHLSAKFGLVYLSERLLSVNHDDCSIPANSKDSYGMTPLSWAAEAGQEAVVKLLVETGKADVESKDQGGRTPLSTAVVRGHETIVELLMDIGKADINTKDKKGQTPFYKAAKRGHERIVKLLVDMGKVDINSKDKKGQTPFSKAAERGHERIVKLLVETGMIEIDCRDKNGHTPLSKAAERGHEKIVKLLVETDMTEIDCRDKNGQTPLSKAAERGHERIVKLLLDTGKVDIDSKDIDGHTPLSKAAERGHERIVKILVDTGKVDINSTGRDGRTPLFCAAGLGREAVVRLFVETYKAEVDLRDEYGRTPLLWAAESGQVPMVKLLIEIGKDEVDSKDDDGRTPLSSAAANGDDAIVKLLLETGKVDVDSQDIDGRTPLSWAAARGRGPSLIPLYNSMWKPDSWGQHENVVKLLIETGKVNPNLKDRYGYTPMSWPTLMINDEPIIDLLRH